MGRELWVWVCAEGGREGEGGVYRKMNDEKTRGKDERKEAKRGKRDRQARRWY
jgi:hypothetical protein